MLGKRLKELRGKRTQEEVSKKLGISRARYSHYENEFVQPDNDLLQKIADLHNVTVDYLLGRDDYVDIPSNETEHIIRELVKEYNLDLTIPGQKERLTDLIKIVLTDHERKQ